MPFRRYLFLGLTAMLVVVLVSLVLRSRKRETARARPAPEVIRVAPATPTRVMRPADLEIVEARVALGAATGRERAAELTVVLRNSGTLAYRDPMLELSCRERGGRKISTRARPVESVIPPGKPTTVGGLREEGLPAAAAECSVRVLWADIDASAAGPPPARK